MTLEEEINRFERLASNYEFNLEMHQHNVMKLSVNDIEIMKKYAQENRQCAEWLKELIKLRNFTHFIARNVMEDDFEENGRFYAEMFCRRLNKLGVIRSENNKWVYDEEVNADEIQS